MPEASTALLKVPAAYGRALVNRFGADPAARADLLAKAGVEEVVVSPLSGEIDLGVLLRITSAVTSMHGEDWSLQAPEVWANAMQGALEVAARSAPTIGEGIAVLAKYGAVRAPYLLIKLIGNGRYARLTIERAVPVDDATWRAIAYAVALSVHAMLAQMCGGALEGARIMFPWRAPSFALGLAQRLGCRLEFVAARFAIEAPAALCARASPFAEPELHSRALAELERAMERRGVREGAILRDAARLITAKLPQRMGEDEAAALLGMSRRTLVRRLKVAGKTYHRLLDDILRERAATMLQRAETSRNEMAAALGYADPTSFSRACRRWFGPG